MAHLMPLAGILLALSVLASIVASFGSLSQEIAGILQLASGILLWTLVPSRVRLQSLLLLITGFGCLLLSSPETIPIMAAFSKNQQIIAMLAAIGLLRRVPPAKETAKLPSGGKALWQTMFGVHWMGSVINISALAIIADRLVDSLGRLNPFQTVMLARSFSLAAMWSPFFVGMGVAITYAPGADYRILMLWGLPLSQLLLAFMLCLVARRKPNDVSGFYGYPFRTNALTGPLILVAAVLIGHSLLPGVSIITLITLLAPSYSLLVNLRNRPLNILSQFICKDMPGMGPEIVLFVSAGILGAGLSTLVTVSAISLNGGLNQTFLVSAGIALILAASCVGIHPVIGIAVVSGILPKANIDPNLLAMGFLISWGLGVLINPISGIHLFLTGRYAFDGHNAWRWNFQFVALSYMASCLWLYLYSL